VLFDETYIHTAQNDSNVNRIILFCDVERPLRTPVMRALNRFAIRHVVGLAATKNVEGEKVGLANRAFRHLYRWRRPFRQFKRGNRSAYYAVKYALIVAMFWLALFGGYRILH
jgi:beta-hydroxylase